MKRFLAMALSFLLGRFNPSRVREQMIALLMLRLRKVALLLSLLLGSSFGIMLTLVYTLRSLGENYDQSGVVMFNGTTLASILGFLIFTLVFAATLTQASWLENIPLRSDQDLPTRPRSSIEDSLSLLLSDIVKEREFNREIRRAELFRKRPDQQENRFAGNHFTSEPELPPSGIQPAV